MSLIKIKYFLFLTFFIIISCKNQVNEDLITREKMVKILLDMHIAEESISELPYDKDTLKALFLMNEKEILNKYSVSELDYRSSYSYYFFNPKELDEIYRSVIDSLSLYQQMK